MATKIDRDWGKIAGRVHAAEETRCPCGDTGSWDDTVSGTSEDKPCVWAGCPNCGSAIARPLLRPDYNAWLKLPLQRQRELVAQAAVRRVFGDAVKVAGWVDQSGLAADSILVRWTEGDSPTYERLVTFVPESCRLDEMIEGHR
jgi:hypothetical protein